MEIKAITKYARMSAFKVREVTREIQGLPAIDAMDLCRFSPKKSAKLVRKTLASAIANAENNNNMRIQNLKVKEAVVGEGPTLKRFTPKARGSAGPTLKRTSHIVIVLTEKADEPKAEKKAAKEKAKK